MIPRYSLPEMSAIWSESHKLAVWKEVETLVVEAWVREGVAPQAAADATRAAPEVDVTEWHERERITNHDVAAFVDVLAESVTEGGEWVHYGLTSSDVLDTAQGRILRDAALLLLKRVADLFAVVQRRALEHRNTVMIGRTHGIWAEPTSFGLKLATWAFELERDYHRLRHARDAVAVGKISGAVGTYAHTPPSVEAYVCERLGIGIEPASSQITHRDRHAELLSAIALTGSSLERFATEIRHLQRSEVGEARESFGKGQKGSSAMPHKRNPIASENVTGLSRILRAYAGAGLENVALWHERDISHSSAERVALPDACIALDFALVRMTKLVDGLVVDTERMLANLIDTRGLVYSQAVLLALIETQGLSRDEAYRIVQRNAMQAWDEGGQLHDLLRADPEVELDADQLADCFSAERFLRNSGVVFERLEAVTL
ncbi:MAG: adenylosuccinate lyase [Acidimicrobiia bacterium]|nr:adenylosuccinate lyase [Acidimicrobiia bacterium]